MNITSLTVLLLALCNAILGAVVCHKDPHRAENKWFGLFALSVTLWSFGLALLYSSSESSKLSSIATGRLAFCAASILPYSFLGFAKYFAIESPLPSRNQLRALAIPASLLSALSFSPWMVAEVTVSQGRLRTAYGPLYTPFAAYFLICLTLSFWVLYRKLRGTSGRTRLQLKYLYLGLFMAIAGGTTTNLVIPLLFQSSSFGGYGPLFVSLLLAFTTHAIVRYRLMDIRVVLRAGLTYFFAVTLAAATFVTLLVTLASILKTTPNDVPLPLQLGLAVVVAITFHPLKQFIQHWIDRYVYRSSYDYQTTLRNATRKIGTTLELKSLTLLLCDVTLDTFQPEAVQLYLRTPDRRTYQLDSTRSRLDVNTTETRVELPSASPLLRFLLATRRPLSIDDEPNDVLTLPAQRQLSHFNLSLALPLCLDDDLIAIILVGKKLSGDPFFASDIDLLSTLAAQTSISLRNAQLYSEVVLANNYVENLLATIDSGVIAVANTGIITLFNSAAEKLTGQSAVSVLGQPIDLLTTPISARLRLALSLDQRTLQDEAALVDGTGRLLPVVCSTSPLRGRNGDVLGAVMIINDITHLKELDAEKRRAERLGSFGALASGIAHEIKNPLVAIRTFAELLPERYSEEDFRGGFSQIVVNEIARIDGLVARLRDLAAPARPILATTDIREPIADTLSLLRGQLDQKQITVSTEYLTTRLLIPADPAQLKQLFLNIFLNAIDAMVSAGSLTIRLTERESAAAPILLVEIADTGCGITTSLIDRVFDPFVTSKSTGSGLGLAICRGIMDAHAGTISVTNNSDRPGATIALEFPTSLQPDAILTVKG